MPARTGTVTAMSDGDWDRLLSVLADNRAVLRLDSWTSSLVYNLVVLGRFDSVPGRERARKVHYSAHAQDRWFKDHSGQEPVVSCRTLIGHISNQLWVSELVEDGAPSQEARDWVAAVILERIALFSRPWPVGLWRTMYPKDLVGDCEANAYAALEWWQDRQARQDRADTESVPGVAPAEPPGGKDHA